MSVFNLTIQPAQTEFVAKPGSGFTQAYSVTNSSQNQLILTTEVLPWVPLGSDGSVSYDNIVSNPHLQFSLVNADLTLGQNFILKPGETRQLVLKIKSDNTTPLTDSYFTFFINQDINHDLNPDNNQTVASARIGSHILLSTSNTENPTSKFKVLQLSSSPTVKDILFPAITFNGKIANESNYFNKPTGKLIISKNGLTITELDVFPHNVLAHNTRQLACLVNNQPVPCQISPPFWPGVYTASLNLDSSQSFSIAFFVFPYSFMLFVIILGLILSFTLRRRS